MKHSMKRNIAGAIKVNGASSLLDYFSPLRQRVRHDIGTFVTCEVRLQGRTGNAIATSPLSFKPGS